MLPEIVLDFEAGVNPCHLATVQFSDGDSHADSYLTALHPTVTGGVPDPSPQGLDFILEQFSATECLSRARPLIEGRNPATGEALLFRPRCKSWSCKPCALLNARLWAFRAAYGLDMLTRQGRFLFSASGDRRSAVTESIATENRSVPGLDFVTLTSHEKLSPSRSVDVFGHAWNSLNRRISRQGRAEYLLVPEQHKTGKLHIHMLTTAKLRKKWWKDNARSCGLGYQVEVETIHDPGKAAGYTLKYVTKSLENNAWPKGFRRVRTSRGWPKPPESAIFDGWTFKVLPRDTQLDDEIELLRAAGFRVALAT